MSVAACSTCKHWTPPDPDDPDDPEGPEPSAYGKCKIAQSVDGMPVIPLAPAYAKDSELYGASLATMATFGCTLHVPAAATEGK